MMLFLALRVCCDGPGDSEKETKGEVVYQPQKPMIYFPLNQDSLVRWAISIPRTL